MASTVSVRRAEAEDADFVNAIMADSLSTLRRRFGTFDVAALIESAYLSVTAVNEVGEVVGFASFSDSPTLNYVAEDWLAWFQRSCGAEDVGAANTVWLSCFVARDEYALDAAENIVRTAFTTLNDSDYMVLLLNSSEEIFAPLSHSFEEVAITDKEASDELDYDGEFVDRTVYVCNREVFIPTLLVRPARVEDHDDLVPIFNSQSEVLTELYGEFFLAELIEAQDAKTKALVAEVDGRAVGLMSLTRDIKLDVLQQCFELGPYNNLMQRTRGEALAAEAAVRANKRERRDWLAQLRAHAEETEELLGSLSGAGAGAGDSGGVVNAERLCTALNQKGVAWSFEGARGRGLGDSMVRDLNIGGRALTRDELDSAVADFSDTRALADLKHAVYTWYGKHDGRGTVLKAFNLAANYEAREAGKEAAVAEATTAVGTGDDADGKAAEGKDAEGKAAEPAAAEEAEVMRVALGDLAAVISVLVNESKARYVSESGSAGDDVLDLLGLDAPPPATESKEGGGGEADGEGKDGAVEGVDAAEGKGDDAAAAAGAEEGDDAEAGDGDGAGVDDGIVRVSMQQLEDALDKLETAMQAANSVRVAMVGPPSAGKKTQAAALSAALNLVVVDVQKLVDDTVPPEEDEEEEEEPSDSDEDGEGKEAKEELDEAEKEKRAAAAANARKFSYGIQDLVSRLQEPDCYEGWVLTGVPTAPTQAAEMAKALADAGLHTRALNLVATDRVVRQRALGGGKEKDAAAEEEFGAKFLEWKTNKQRTLAALASAGALGAGPAEVLEWPTQPSDADAAMMDATDLGSGALPVIEVDAYGSPTAVTAELMLSLVDAGVRRSDIEIADEEAEEAAAEEAAELEAAGGGGGGPTANAFAVTLFCLDELFDSRAADFLQHAFASFEDLEYCLLTLPHSSPETPLLSAFTLTPAKPSSTFSHVLYVAHRASLLSPRFLEVRRANPADRLGIAELLEGLDVASEVLAAASRCDEDGEVPLTSNPKSVAIVATCQDQVVGVAVLSSEAMTEERVEALRNSFELERYVLLAKHRLRQQCELKQFVVNPVFAASSRYVLRQAMRLYSKTVLYYPLRATDAPAPVIEEFVQVRPRHKPEAAGSGGLEAETAAIASGAAPRPGADAGDDAHALFFLTRKLMSEAKLVNNARVVVVGASDCGVSFIETLLMVAYIRFTNITLISPGGLPASASQIAATLTAEQAGSPFGAGADYSPMEMERLALAARIRVIDSRVCEIDRDAKAVVLPDDSIVPYDVLVLSAGLQDPTANKLGVGEAASSGYDGDELASCVFSLSTTASGRADALEAAVGDLAADVGDGVAVATDIAVVYGDTAEALSAVQAMLARGVPGNRILHVRPGKDAILDDPVAHAMVTDALAAAGVVSRTRTTLVQVQRRDDGGAGVSLVLEEQERAPADSGSSAAAAASGRVVRQAVACRVLVTAHTRDVDSSLFAAVNGCGLPYDGRLVVDHKFRTTQRDIYAAGTLAKFARRYRARQWVEAHNSREVGAALGYSVLGELDPLMAGDAAAGGDGGAGFDAEFGEVRGSASLQKFVLPRRTTLVLPGSLHYLRCSLAAVDMGSAGRELTTNVSREDSTDGHSHYVKLTMDRYGRLADLTYVGTERVEAGNMSLLVGRHSGFMNGVERDLDNKVVSDLIPFFRLDWAYAVYHDLFDYLCLELRDALADDEALKALMQETWTNASEGGSDTFLRKKRDEKVGPFGSKLQPSTRRTIETGVIEFLRANKSMLPMYFLPGAAAAPGSAEA